MLHFECDYAEGAHPRILERLAATNLEQTDGYGVDPHCQRARELILAQCQAPEADVHFLVGGTQVNTAIIAAGLRPWQGVLSAASGHINVHETGAVEATGHKVLALPHRDGKVRAEAIDRAISGHYADGNAEHMVQPGMVYLSNPTEYGTLYTKAELTAISQVCRRWRVPLYVDGARLGYALGAAGNDLFLPDYAALCDAFTVGGTKVGALFGEALVITSPELNRDFRYTIKQRGGMLAKGRLLGIQFEVLFEDGLYQALGEKADRQAMALRRAFEEKGCAMLLDSRTNQQFPVLSRAQQAELAEKYQFSYWEPVAEGRDAVRFCTSWATTDEALERLMADIRTKL
ncbi:MAG: aminotransferase class I/II-fold pyridoxal phosphate-dependent enzyme [Clostridiales bacterium]|nr:aminotransferase class I/II-fold pyridoxal phosphate-dependent enzyme [Clostridiales bacterium]